MLDVRVPARDLHLDRNAIFGGDGRVLLDARHGCHGRSVQFGEHLIEAAARRA